MCLVAQGFIRAVLRYKFYRSATSLDPTCHAISILYIVQVDDGMSWTEPTAIIHGKPEGGQEVRS